MPATDETDRMPEGLRQILDNLAAVAGHADGCLIYAGTSRTFAAYEDIALIGLHGSPARYRLKEAGQALHELLNAADMIQSAERDIAEAGYRYSVKRGPRGMWQVSIHEDDGYPCRPCEVRPTLAAAMWEARTDAIARKQ
jgi:hypothetical protein